MCRGRPGRKWLPGEYEAAIALAASLKADRGILDRISDHGGNDHGGNLGGLIGNIGSAPR